MPFGGLIGVDKHGAMLQINHSLLPKTIRLKPGTKAVSAIVFMSEHQITFPCVLKPNDGERGRGVEIIENDVDMANYLEKYGQEELLLQEFVDYPIELGVFVYKDPESGKWKIPSVVQKKFFGVIGDGKKTVGELVQVSKRGKLIFPRLKQKYQPFWDSVLPTGQKLCLEKIGNHCRGTEFVSGQELINARLHEVFSEIADGISGFEYGRFDLKVKSLEDLYNGTKIQILEINGINAEPGHIYDANYTLFRAYSDVKKHFDILYSIAAKKDKSFGTNCSLSTFIHSFRKHSRLSQ